MIDEPKFNAIGYGSRLLGYALLHPTYEAYAN
jgi:hypothetical protein